jgi:hypothetical protein
MGYTNDALRCMVSSENGQKLLIKASEAKGESADSPASAKEIPEFIKFHNLDMSVVLVCTSKQGRMEDGEWRMGNGR